MECDADAMDLEELSDKIFSDAPHGNTGDDDDDDPLQFFYGMPLPPEDGTAKQKWEEARRRFGKRRRPLEWGLLKTAIGDRSDGDEEPMSKMRKCGEVSQAHLDTANRPYATVALKELQSRMQNSALLPEERNWARDRYQQLLRDLGYYRFRIPWKPGAPATERLTEYSATPQLLLGEPLLVEVAEFPTNVPGEDHARLLPCDSVGTHRRLNIFPTTVVDFRDEVFIRAIGNKRRLTVHISNMEWAEDIQRLAELFGSSDVAEAFGIHYDTSLGNDLIHFLLWLVGNTSYLSLRTSPRCYWYHQEFKHVKGRINPFGDAHKTYLKYIFQQHLQDDDFRTQRPREHETLTETWMSAMQALENVQLLDGVLCDYNFPRTSWMPDPVKKILVLLARDCIDVDSGRLHWHPSWNALDYCLLLGEWFLTTS
jgi:hypothetical protein